MWDESKATVTCDYSYGGDKVCGKPATHVFSAAYHTKWRVEGHGDCCDEHYAFACDAALPLEVQFGHEIDLCKALKLEAKAHMPKAKPRLPKICPHCGKPL